MTKWIVVGVVVLTAACLTERVSAQSTPTAPQEATVVPASPVTMVPVITRSGLFGRRRVVMYQPVYQQTTGVPVVTGQAGGTVYYPPVVQQPIIPATVAGTPATGIQQAQAVSPTPIVVPQTGSVIVPQTGSVIVPQTGPVVTQNAPVYYQVRRGLFGRLRMRAVRY